MVKLAVFALVSAGFLYVSWGSLRVVGSHGFYRFFAWEAILGLVLLAIHDWFTDPLSARQIASWILLVVSAIMALPGAYQILVKGKPDARRKDDTLMNFEKTSVLVTSGVYRYIRHPLYGSLLFLAWGAFLKSPSPSAWGLVAVASVFLYATAKADESECIKFFGSSYEEYMQHSKMFVPFLF